MILKRCLITDTYESDDDVVKGLSLSLSLFYACSNSDCVVISECCQKSYVTFQSARCLSTSCVDADGGLKLLCLDQPISQYQY